MMKYEEPNMQILLLKELDVITASTLTSQEYDKVDKGNWSEWF